MSYGGKATPSGTLFVENVLPTIVSLEGEKLEVDRRAYDMRHVLNMEWPCLSFDVLNDTDGLGRVKVLPSS